MGSNERRIYSMTCCVEKTHKENTWANDSNSNNSSSDGKRKCYSPYGTQEKKKEDFKHRLRQVFQSNTLNVCVCKSANVRLFAGTSEASRTENCPMGKQCAALRVSVNQKEIVAGKKRKRETKRKKTGP